MPDQMDPMTLAMLSGNPDALQTMRQYALAQHLQQMSLGGPKQPEQLGLGGNYPHASRIGAASAVAPLAEALMANKGFKTASPAMSNLFSGGSPSGGSQPAAPQEQTDPYAPVTPADIAQTNVPGLPGAGRIPMIAMSQGKDPVAAMEAYRNQQKGLLAQQHSPDVARLDGMIFSDHPAQYARSDLAFMQHWPALAQSMKVDPIDGFTDQNVRRALGMVRNPLATSIGLPEKEIPEQPIPVIGNYGYRGEKSPVTGQEKEVQGAQLPTYAGEDVYDPKTGTTVKRFEQTGGWFPGMSRGVGQPNVPSQSPPSSPGVPSPQPSAGPQGGNPQFFNKTGPADVSLGMGTPKPGEFESAGYAQYMRGGLQGVRRLESQGYSLSPQARAIVIDVATSEEGGITSQVLRQEMLKHGLNMEGPQAQAYLASLMPMLQAAGHAMAGARLTAGQMRTNFESLIPLDAKNKPAMAQIDTNRNNFYSSLLGQAGGAIRSPLYQNTLGTDFDHIQAGHKLVKGQWYEQRPDGKIYPAGP
jgi:hypothetical protein